MRPADQPSRTFSSFDSTEPQPRSNVLCSATPSSVGCDRSRRDDVTILPRTPAGVHDVLLRRLVDPASLGSVVDREHGAASVVATRSIVRVRPGGTSPATGRDAADRKALLVSLCHRLRTSVPSSIERPGATRRPSGSNVTTHVSTFIATGTTPPN